MKYLCYHSVLPKSLYKYVMCLTILDFESRIEGNTFQTVLNDCNVRLRIRSDFSKHLTIKNCDKIFLKSILRKFVKKRRFLDVELTSLSSQDDS